VAATTLAVDHENSATPRRDEPGSFNA